MPTNVAGNVGRQLQTQQVHYLRFDVNYNDAATGVPVKKQTLPAGAQILGSYVTVNTAFNAATTNVLSVGTEASTYTNIITTAQAAANAAGLKSNLPPTGLMLVKVATASDVYALYSQTGTAATAGNATITIMYTVANDL